jgi:hypothetical protein
MVLCLLGATVLSAAEAYTWVDENNERHWSDTPRAGAEKIDLTPQNVFSAPLVPVASRGASTPGGTDAPSPYSSCAIAQPTPDQVYFDIESLTISVQLAPNRRPGDTITVTLDGRNVAPAASGGFVVSPIDRGTHTAAAMVRDASGRTLCTAASVTFHVRQHSVARPP